MFYNEDGFKIQGFWEVKFLIENSKGESRKWEDLTDEEKDQIVESIRNGIFMGEMEEPFDEEYQKQYDEWLNEDD